MGKKTVCRQVEEGGGGWRRDEEKQRNKSVRLKVQLTQNVRVCAGCAVKDYGNLTFEEPPDDEPVGRVKHVRAVGSANQRLSEAVQAVKLDGRVSLMLGGDHR